MIDERIEQLINRKLDGELTEAESLELDKALIRSPEAHALLDEYERNDSQAAGALQDAFSDDTSAHERAEELSGLAFDPRRRWRMVVGFGAIAAAIVLAAMIVRIPAGWLRSHEISPGNYIVDNNKQEPAPVDNDTPVNDRTPSLIVEEPNRYRERIHRDIFGVFDVETESFYLLERDRAHRTVVPVSMNY